MDWILVVTWIITAGATLALAIVGWAALHREKNREEKVAGARVSFLAFPLRRQLRSWLEEWPENPSDTERWTFARRLARRGFDDAERRLEEMLGEAAKASQATHSEVERAASRFWEATRYLNETHACGEAVPLQKGGVIAYHLPRSVRERFDAAEGILGECVEVLGALIGEGMEEPRALPRASGRGRLPEGETPDSQQPRSYQ